MMWMFNCNLDNHVYFAACISEYPYFFSSIAVDDKPVVFEKFKPKRKKAPPPPNPFGSDEEEETIPDPPSSAEKSSHPSKEPPPSVTLNPFEEEDEEVTQYLFFSFVVLSQTLTLRAGFVCQRSKLREMGRWCSESLVSNWILLLSSFC